MKTEYQFGFETLKVWQKAKDLSIQVYKLTSSFPERERYSLTSQINRAVISIPANIAEGSSRTSSKDQIHFYSIAYSSMMELASHVIIAFELSYLDEDNYFDIKSRIHEVSLMLNSLYNSQK